MKWPNWFKRPAAVTPAVPQAAAPVSIPIPGSRVSDRDRRPAGPGAAQSSLSGRPSYAGSQGAYLTLPREQSDRLLAQFRTSLPVVKRTLEILAGFTGVPTFCVGDDETAAAELNQWACEAVQYGDGVGLGLSPWVRDLIDQSLTYGFAVGEAEALGDRSGVARLWTYLSPQIRFRTNAEGALEIRQWSAAGEFTLNPYTTARVTHGARACNPLGESLLLSLPTFCQALLDVVYAHRQTWKRNGIPIFHIHTELPEGFSDPDGSISADIIESQATAWNESIRSQYVDGKAKDFFTCGVGPTTVKAIGAESEVMDIEVAHRVLAEEIIAATGIPPFMFGFSWSTTERMSKQQADMLTATIDCLRREVSGAILHVARLHRQLSGHADAEAITLCWPDISLQDLKDTASAAALDAQAALSRQKFWRQLWTDGVIGQERYAEELTGSAEVDEPLAEPPGMQPTAPEGEPTGDPEKAAAEARAEYPDLWACGHDHA